MKRIKVKKYLDFQKKCQVVNEIVEMSFTGIEYDPLVMECAKVFTIAKYYSDVDIVMEDRKEDAVKTYDALNRNGTYYNKIYKKIPKQEIAKVEEMLENLIEEKKHRSNITYELTKKLSTIDPEKLLGELKEFDFSKFEGIQKVLDLNNSATKKAWFDGYIRSNNE